MKFSQGSVAGTSLVPHVGITIAMLSLELKLLCVMCGKPFLFVQVEVLASLQRPKKVTVTANDGNSYIFLCKPKVVL